MESARPIRLGVLVSGNGTNLQALIDAILLGKLDAEIVLVLSNKPDVPALTRCQLANLPYLVIPSSRFPDRRAYDEALAKELEKKEVELVILAGFMRIVSEAFLAYFPDRVINLHPALLPDNPEDDRITLPDGTASAVFRGLNVVAQALEAGVKWSGATVHLVTADVDRGPVLKRETVPILPGDTAEALHARIQEVEHRILPQAVADWGRRLRKKVTR